MRTINPFTSLRGNGERSRTIKFYTLGCKVNQYETQAIRERFIHAGFKELTDGKIADVYLINTCTVTHRADRSSRYFIYQAHRENPYAKIIVTGCYTELDSDEIVNIPGVTHIIKNQDKNRIVELLNGPNGLNGPNERSITNFKGHTRAFLKVQDGCNNFCSYCKVPLVRGVSRSRPLDEIVVEAGQLVRNGFKELVLCGICLGAYGKDFASKLDIVDVIDKLEKIDDLLRLRLSSIELGDISDRLVQKMAQSQKLCRHLHIPLQSGDDEILKKMNRNYTASDYLKLIKKIKSQIPEVAITTDVLVGFPGESEVNFQNTVGLIKHVLALKVHIFPYSKRKETVAANYFKDEIGPLIIKDRAGRLKAIAEDCSLNFRKQFLNKKMNVLIEGHGRNNTGFWEGYTANYIKALVKSKQNLKNQIICVKLKMINKDYILVDFV